MNNTKPAILIQGKNIILVISNKSHTISKDTHVSYGKIVDALKSQDWDALHDLIEPKKAIVNFGKGHVAISVDNQVTWKGQPFHNALASRMIEMYQDGFPIDPMVRFMENLMQNPSKRSVDQVYSFLEKNKLPITEDGCFLAFKRVRADFRDVHSGTIDNSVGQVVEMDRNSVDDNPDSHCSTGLHFCSESYLKHFGGQDDPVMILKINPRDVVSIPTDYNGAKGRCCKYEVVGQVGQVAPADMFTSVVNEEYSEKLELPELDNYQDGWPFPIGATQKPVAPASTVNSTEQLYDLYRVHGDYLEYSGFTLSECRDIVVKHKAQKKALLYIVDENGDIVQ